MLKATNQFNFAVRLSALVLVVGIVGACSHAVPLDPQLNYIPTKQPIPLTIGVFLSPQLTTYEYSGSRYGDTWVFPLGQESVDLLEEAFAKAFQRTVRVKRLPPYEESAPTLDAVIEPKIVSFTFDLPMIKSGVYTAEIAYSFKLHSVKGAPIGSWRVIGVGERRGEIGFEFARWPGNAANAAMEDAARKFIDGVEFVPEVRRIVREKHAVSARYMWPLEFQ